MGRTELSETEGRERSSQINVIQPYAHLMPLAGGGECFTRDDGIQLLKRIEWCARISHRSEDAATENSYDRFVRSVVLQHGDWSVTEHASVSVDFCVDRGITHEVVRHRLFGFTQESTRFVNYEKKMPPSFVYPDKGVELHPAWIRAVEMAERSYRELLAAGWSPQLARSVFPNALASRLVVTGNLRSWRHFLLMRTTKEAHPQMREVTVPLLAEFQEKIPILFEDIEPGARQSENLNKEEV
jgi:thymidylate synthase (FAD)